MTNSDYLKFQKTTESKNFGEIQQRLTEENVRLLHAAIGMVTETGEIQDQLKKHIFYGKPLDKVNLKEEMGDLVYYLALMCNVLGLTFEEVLERNVEKLQARYPKGFTQKDAVERNLEVERAILEK